MGSHWQKRKLSTGLIDHGMTWSGKAAAKPEDNKIWGKENPCDRENNTYFGHLEPLRIGAFSFQLALPKARPGVASLLVSGSRTVSRKH